MREGSAHVAEHGGRITGYTTGIAFFAHSVGETNEDLKALIAAASEFAGPGFLLPARNGELYRWSLAHGLKVGQLMTLMTLGLYNEPAGAYLPSIPSPHCTEGASTAPSRASPRRTSAIWRRHQPALEFGGSFARSTPALEPWLLRQCSAGVVASCRTLDYPCRRSAAASRASCSMAGQSPAVTRSAGATHEPPTQATLGRAR